MYKQKSWNVENMHMGVIKAFIVMSMLFVCMFSLKISARAEESKEYYFNSYGLNENTTSYTYHINECKFSTDFNLCFVFAGNYEEVDLSGNVHNASRYYPCMSYKDGVHMFYYSYTKTRLNAKYEVIKTISSSSSQNFYNLDYIKNGGYVEFVRSVWKPLETNIPIFESIEDAEYYFETGEIPQEVVRIPSYVNDKYIESYSLKGFECDLTVSAKWTGHTRYIPPTLKPQKAIEKIIVEGIYFNEDEPCIFDILDINTTSWSRDIEEIRVDNNGNTLQSILFTPYYYFEDDETIYYGNRITVDPRDWSLGFGVVYDYDDDGNMYTMKNLVIDYNEDNSLGYLQGVKREYVAELLWGTGFKITWDSVNESLNDCHVQIALRYIQEKPTTPKLYNTVPYKQYADNVLYTDGKLLFNDKELNKYYKDNYYNAKYGGDYEIDVVMLRLVRYDTENNKYIYGGWVVVDPAVIKSDGVYTSNVDKYGNISADNSSSDSYTDTSGQLHELSKEKLSVTSNDFLGSLNTAHQFISDGNFDAFLKTSFSFIPTEIWTIILSGLSVIVGFLIVKLVMRVL